MAEAPHDDSMQRHAPDDSAFYEPSQEIGRYPRLFAKARYIALFAVLGLVLASTTLLIYGLLAVLQIIWDTISHGELSLDGAQSLAIEFVEMTDIFLLGTVIYIVGLGLYELFVNPELPLPSWLHITDLDDLKSKLIGVLVVLLGVNFLVELANWDGETDMLKLGVGIGAVILALAAVNYLTDLMRKNNQH
jgi:uncharacterized membrane protein YqhA